MRKNNAGFTLIEILIATLIFGWIATETARAIRNTNQAKSKIDEEIDTFQAVRSAFAIISHDINGIFHLSPIDFLPFGHLLPEDRPDNIKDPTQYQSYIDEKYPGLKYKSYFVGTPTEIHFTSLTHFRVYSSRHESEQAEISFNVAADKSDPSILHLYKREFPVIDDKFNEGGNEFLLLEDLSAVKFRYFDGEKEEWRDRWDTSTAEVHDELPNLIEVSLVVNMRHPLRGEEVQKLEILTSFHPMFMNSYHYAGIGALEPLEKAMQPAATPNADNQQPPPQPPSEPKNP